MEQALLLRFISVYLQIIERKNILFHKLENPTSLNDYDDISAGNLNLCFHRTCTFDSRTNCIWKLSHIHFNGYISPFLLLNSNRARSDQILICRHNKTFGNRAKKKNKKTTHYCNSTKSVFSFTCVYEQNFSIDSKSFCGALNILQNLWSFIVKDISAK